jgi:hypothetical protein
MAERSVVSLFNIRRRKETTVGYCSRESERRSISDVISAMKTKRKLSSETSEEPLGAV